MHVLNIQFTLHPHIILKASQIDLYCQHLLPKITFNRKINFEAKIETIGSLLSMERNNLTSNQIKKILKGKKISAKDNDVIEAKNAARIYPLLSHLNPLSLSDFKHAHALLMKNLIETNGQWRKEPVFVFEKKKIAHIPADPKEVPYLMRHVFHYLKTKHKFSGVIKACICHYAIQNIHPFSDGNGRMGRLWQHLMLLRESPLFRYIQIGHIINANLRSYYRSLDKSDKLQDASFFVSFCLEKIIQEIRQLAKKQGITLLSKKPLPSPINLRDYMLFKNDYSASTI